MCRWASLVLTKKAAYMGPTDSHTDILERHGLKDVMRGETAIVKFEILPPDGDSTRPLEDWTVVVDQDVLPDWFVSETDKARALDALRRSGVVPLSIAFVAECVGALDPLDGLDENSRIIKVRALIKEYRIARAGLTQRAL